MFTSHRGARLPSFSYWARYLTTPSSFSPSRLPSCAVMRAAFSHLGSKTPSLDRSTRVRAIARHSTSPSSITASRKLASHYKRAVLKVAAISNTPLCRCLDRLIICGGWLVISHASAAGVTSAYRRFRGLFIFITPILAGLQTRKSTIKRVVCAATEHINLIFLSYLSVTPGILHQHHRVAVSTDAERQPRRHLEHTHFIICRRSTMANSVWRPRRNRVLMVLHVTLAVLLAA